MKPDPNYPRMMFHWTLDPVIVYSRDEELLLGGEWSRTIGGSPPREEKPPDPEPEPEEEPDEEPEEEPPLLKEPEKIRVHQSAPPAKPQAKRGRPAAHKGAHKRKD